MKETEMSKKFIPDFVKENEGAIAAITAEGYHNAHENRKLVTAFTTASKKVHDAGDYPNQADKDEKCRLKTLLDAAVNKYKQSLSDGNTEDNVTSISPESTAKTVASEDGKAKSAAA